MSDAEKLLPIARTLSGRDEVAEKAHAEAMAAHRTTNDFLFMGVIIP